MMSTPSRFTCYNCNLSTSNWGIIVQHGCFRNSSALLTVDNENRVYLQEDQSEVDGKTEVDTETVETQIAENYNENDSNDEEQGNNEGPVVNGWSREAVLLLFAKYEENKEGLEKKNGVKKHIWRRIASEMRRTHGFQFSWDQVQNKWKCLIRTYKSIRDHNSRSGHNRKSWLYFQEMDKLQSKNPAVEPPVVVHNGQLIPHTSQSPSSSNATITGSVIHQAETPNSINTGSVELGETSRAHKRRRDLDTNELLLLAIEESKKQHQEDLEEKRKFNNLLEMLINITKNQNGK